MKMYEITNKATGVKEIMNAELAAYFKTLLVVTGRVDEVEIKEIEC